jgi:hypothetical protein
MRGRISTMPLKEVDVRVRENILRFYKEIEHDQYHRYSSWEHCYSFIQNIQRAGSKTAEFIDIATLHLAFYLASWGMYRGSSELLQKDYKIHTQIVQEILDDKYRRLWRINFDVQPETDLVILLAKRLRQIYSGLGISPTDTLITKVILGTLGCTPAYDTFFINGVTYWKKELPSEYSPKFPARFGPNSYRGLVDFYRGHRQAFEDAQGHIAHRGIIYPVMKLADMYFWSLGYQLECLKRATAHSG